MNSERMSWAFRTSLSRYASSLGSLDDFDDIIDFMTSECQSSGLDLDTDAASQDIERTLEDLASHPLTAILEEHLVDLLSVDKRDVPLLVDEILDAYQTGTHV